VFSKYEPADPATSLNIVMSETTTGIALDIASINGIPKPSSFEADTRAKLSSRIC
jgi:hypothetical protein